MADFSFKTQGLRGSLRLGKFKVPHGEVLTPVFMPVGTKATVKSLTPDDLVGVGAGIILGNTYHLFLQPGEETVAKLGGLHDFMGWRGPILTDSGGYQVSSLSKADASDVANEEGAKLAKVTEDGVHFFSHLDGSRHFMTPEKSVQIQEKLGADIIMAFDECSPNLGKQYARESLDRTNRWLVRSKKEWERLESKKEGEAPQYLFGIIQGAGYKDLRVESAKAVVGEDLSGIAIGGDLIGPDMKKTVEIISWVKEYLPEGKPFYAMGVGKSPQDLFDVFYAGVDMVDCVAPTRLARSGLIYRGKFEMSSGKWSFVSENNKGRVDIGQKKWSLEKGPVMDKCDCYTCQRFSMGYLHHLYKAKEILYHRLATIHNLRVMIRVGEILRAG